MLPRAGGTHRCGALSRCAGAALVASAGKWWEKALAEPGVQMRCLPGAELSPEGPWQGEGMGYHGTAPLATANLMGRPPGSPSLH